MNTVLVHNFYQQPGGEDQVFADEASLLESRGHRVERFTVHNTRVESMGRAEIARKTIWNDESARALADVVRKSEADVVHFHNTFPLISPAAYQAVRKEGAAVVQTLHNYRLMCPSATLFRDNHVCEECVGRAIPWPAVAHGCYRSSRSASAAVAVMLTVHRARGTYREDVDAYIALTEFARSKFIESGLPSDRIFVKPNFVRPDPGVGAGSGKGEYAVFVGRLTADKGIPFLLKAWQSIGKQLPLKIVGDGPLRSEVEAAAAANPAIQYLGRKTLVDIYDLVGEACALVFPSLWYEGLPRTIVEALAKGTPVLASRLGSMPELVRHGENGLLFRPGDEADLAAQVSRIVRNPGEMRAGARASFEAKFTAEQNYPAMMAIYELALERAAGRVKSTETPHRSSPEARQVPSEPPVGAPGAAAVGSQGVG